MTIKQKLEYLGSITLSQLPKNVADAVTSYLEIADVAENDEAILKEADVYDDIEKLYDKVKSLNVDTEAKKKGSAKVKTTKERAVKGKAAKAARTKPTKQKAAKRAKNKPKAEIKPAPKPQTEKFKVGTFVKVKSTGYVMKVVKNTGVEDADYLVQDLDGDELLANQGDLVFSANPKTKSKRSTSKTEKKPNSKANASKKSTSKSDEKQSEKLKEVKAEFNQWIKKVEKEEATLKQVIALVTPTVKAEGLGLTKTQLEIKQYEAYITILKKIFNRDAKMMKGIMDKAHKALRPQDVESLQRAIVKAQGIVLQQGGMSGISKTLKDNPKAKKKAKSKAKAKPQQPKEQPKKKGFLARLFS